MHSSCMKKQWCWMSAAMQLMGLRCLMTLTELSYSLSGICSPLLSHPVPKKAVGTAASQDSLCFMATCSVIGTFLMPFWPPGSSVRSGAFQGTWQPSAFMRTKAAVVVPLWIGLLPSVGWNLMGSWNNPWIDDAVSKTWIYWERIF